MFDYLSLSRVECWVIFSTVIGADGISGVWKLPIDIPVVDIVLCLPFWTVNRTLENIMRVNFSFCHMWCSEDKLGTFNLFTDPAHGS